MSDEAAVLRLDKLLWYLRFCKSRGTAQSLCESGHIRIDGRRIDRGHAPVRAGCVLTLPLPGGVEVVRVLRLPGRRGPAPEAQAHYERITAGPPQHAADAPGNESDSQLTALP